MAYSTGSGSYTALMAAVLAFAIADGWTTTGGNWPISKGNVRGVDWNTFTASEPDFTGNFGTSVTVRYLRIAIGTSPSDATANALVTAQSAVMANAHYNFTNWWIFSDSGVGKPNYITVVVQFSNGLNVDCFAHFSFGELDKHGMTHTATAYVTASSNRAYAVVNTSQATGNSSRDWNSGGLGNIYRPYCGNAYWEYTTYYHQNNMILIVDPTVNPMPLSGAFPAANSRIGTDLVKDILSDHYTALSTSGIAKGGYGYSLSSWAYHASPQPFTGAVSLYPSPVIVLNNTGTSSQGVVLGSFPNMRWCSTVGYNPGDEISYSSEDWMIFPMLRSTPFSEMQIANVVSSGRVGIAHKKVA